MSILSSNSARFQVTATYLEKNGYVYSASSAILKRQDSRYNDTYNSHIIRVGDTVNNKDLFVKLGSKKGTNYVIHINDIPTLKLLEAFWDARGENNKRKLKSKLIKTPGTEIREWKRNERWVDPRKSSTIFSSLVSM